MNISRKISYFQGIFYFILVLTGYGHEPEAQLPFAHPEAHASLEGHARVGLESRYFLEGRDSLDGDSLVAGSFELGWRNIAGGVWYGYSPDQSYEELQLSLVVSQAVGDFEFYGGYTHLRFPSDNSHDNEIGIGISWSGFPVDIELAADIYYSFDADGYFSEISAGREFVITEELTLNFLGLFGINQGYVADGHDGANYVALKLEIEYALTDCVSIAAHSAYSWGVGRDQMLSGDEQLIDFFHGGIGLQWSF